MKKALLPDKRSSINIYMHRQELKYLCIDKHMIQAEIALQNINKEYLLK